MQLWTYQQVEGKQQEDALRINQYEVFTAYLYESGQIDS
jgi:hypothetical protein